MAYRLLSLVALLTILAACGDDDIAASIDARIPDAAVPDAAAPDARLAFPPVPASAVTCTGTYPTNAVCNENRSDFSCKESDYGDGWVRQDVVNLDCPNGNAVGPCGGSATQPFVISVIRLCRAGGANQDAPCADGVLRKTGPIGCAVCETTNLMCL
jgi:hypothetical protein